MTIDYDKNDPREWDEDEPKITKFESGAIRDSGVGKESYIEPISWIALRRYSQYMAKASAKYGEDNWRKGIPTKSYENSLMRHLQKYLANKYDGANLEPEVDHISAAFFNLMGIIHNEEQQKMPSVQETTLEAPKEIL